MLQDWIEYAKVNDRANFSDSNPVHGYPRRGGGHDAGRLRQRRLHCHGDALRVADHHGSSDDLAPTESPVDDRGRAFLAELEKNGITPAGNGDIAVSTATYICSAQSQGVPADEIATFVTANVGVEASAAGTQITAEQAGEDAQIYIAAATNTFC